MARDYGGHLHWMIYPLSMGLFEFSVEYEMGDFLPTYLIYETAEEIYVSIDLK